MALVTPSSTSPSVRLWRTAFLTLRDETLTSIPGPTVLQLLHHLILSQSDALITAAPDLPAHEVTSDMVFLMELARNISDSGLVQDMVQSFIELSKLIHRVSKCADIEVNSSSSSSMLDCFERIIVTLTGKGKMKRSFFGNPAVIKAIEQCLEITRCLFVACQKTCLLSESKKLLDFLLRVVSDLQTDSTVSSSTSGNRRGLRCNTFWKIQGLVFTIIGEVYSRVGSSLTVDIWQSTFEVLRSVLDVVASTGVLMEESVMPMFYTSVLHCLHLVLLDPKGSLSGHVTGIVTVLRMFFHFGLSAKTDLRLAVVGHIEESSATRNYGETGKRNSGPYRPPHLRKKDLEHLQLGHEESLGALEDESSTVSHLSSDSDYSEGEGSARDSSSVFYAKTRVAAIICLQDLCRADPKTFTAMWTMLLPSSDVLHPRKSEATLMSCLLFDPCLKARIASASAIKSMLEGPASAFLQMAEFKESSKCGSFTALSSSLGQILVQLHSGTLYLIKHEKHGGLLGSFFKILMLLISSTPYSRLPRGLLPTVISSVRERIEEGFAFRNDNTILLATAVNCLAIALSASPSLPEVNDMLLLEAAGGFPNSVDAQKKCGIFTILFRYSQPESSPSISMEALQALRAVAHNFPSTMDLLWEQISSTVFSFLRFSSQALPGSWRYYGGSATGTVDDKVITAAVKVLDECLRAISGFKGTEELSNDKLSGSPFASDYIKIKTISSAPIYGSESTVEIKDDVGRCPSGSMQWVEVIVKHMPLILYHSSAIVRAASVTCFAGMTSSVFSSLPKDEQSFVLVSSIDAALRDEVPAVRAAACRAIGVIACFPGIFDNTEILEKFIHAAEHNSRDTLVSVRITASWALANICDSLRHCINASSFDRSSQSSNTSSILIPLLVENALRMAKDNDKIKANAVRALGNLSRFFRFNNESGSNDKPVDCRSVSPLSNVAEGLSSSDDLRGCSKQYQPSLLQDSSWLEKMVQAFLSCVATGNVKVQWNVCHALSNLFFNENVKLEEMSWAPSVFSILLLLLRDSSNFKIRIQAAAALAVPPSMRDYGRSFCDVLQGVEHILENLSSDHISEPSNFKYRVALEKQLTSTMLHLLGLTSRTDHLAIQEFLSKKAPFLEEWLKMLYLGLEETANDFEAEYYLPVNRKKEVISSAIRSLVEVYEGSNHHTIAKRFDKLATSIL